MHENVVDLTRDTPEEMDPRHDGEGADGEDTVVWRTRKSVEVQDDHTRDGEDEKGMADSSADEVHGIISEGISSVVRG